MSDCNDRKRFGPAFWFSLYFIMIILTGGWSWHRTCDEISIDKDGTRHHDGRWFCSAGIGVVWPFYWATKAGIYVMDPDGPVFRFKPPTVTWD